MLRSIKYGLYGAVLAGLVAAPVVAWGSVDKTVHLVGRRQGRRRVSTSASDVSEVLRATGTCSSAPTTSSRPTSRRRCTRA